MQNYAAVKQLVEGKNRGVPRDLPTMKEPPKVEDDIKFFKLSLQEVLKIIQDKCGPVKITEYQNGSCSIVFLPEASEELESMLHFGKYHPLNVYEQQFQGIGHIFIDDQGHITIVIVQVFYIYSAKRSPAGATVFVDPRDGMYKRLENEREIFNRNLMKRNDLGDGRVVDAFIQYGPCFVNFFGHTHPCKIGLFFSGPDRASSIATEDFPAATFVCDPQEKNMIGAVGIDFLPAKIFMCHYADKNTDVERLLDHKIKDSKISEEVPDKKSDINSQNKDGRSNYEIVTSIINDSNVLVSRGYKGKINTLVTDKGRNHLKLDIKG